MRVYDEIALRAQINDRAATSPYASRQHLLITLTRQEGSSP